MMKKKAQMENQKILMSTKNMVQKIQNKNQTAWKLHQKVIPEKRIIWPMTISSRTKQIK